MHRLHLCSVLATVIACLYAPTALAAAFLENRTIRPLAPSEFDVVRIDVFGVFGSGGHSILGTPTVLISGNDVAINIFSSGCPATCSTEIIPFSVTALVGVLSAGAYNDTVSIFEDGQLVDTLEGTFVIPEPSTRLLFAFVLSSIALRRTLQQEGV